MLIGTHNGKFHADEVFAVAILKRIYSTADVVRSRNIEILGTCDIVVDVGGGKYDHHTTSKVYRDNGIPYASGGLVWRDFGDLVARESGVLDNSTDVISAIDEQLFQGIDASDNGFQLEKDVRIKGISDIIGGFNPSWNSNDNEDAAFQEAVAFASRILTNQIRSEISRLDAVTVVETAYEQREKKEILVLNTVCPWTETLLSLDKDDEVLFVVFPDKSSGYRLQVVPRAHGSFEARKRLPEEWAGKEAEDLGRIVGIHDAVFCHPARFIAGALSRDSIMRMAQLALGN